MADITIKTKLDELRVLFNKMKNVYYLSEANKKLSEVSDFDMEFPVLGEGVTFNTGDVDVTKVKLTTGEVWTALAEAGDSDIQFQVASAAPALAGYLMNAVTKSVAMTSSFSGVTFEGVGYDLNPKKLTGGLFMTSQDKQSAIFLPNIEGYSSLVIEDSKPAYFNVNISPLNDTQGVAIYLLKPKATTTGGGGETAGGGGTTTGK